ncbi:MAG TPA: hypothetical protein VIN67_05725 [Desulfobaccales bacterium]
METKIHPERQVTEAGLETLEIDLIGDRLTSFSPLLQRGVTLRLREETNVSNFLCQHLGIEAEFVEQAITTIFLNGRPVDDLDRARLGNGDTLALSAAMPGLVGATMRRQGLVASFRSNISYREYGRRKQTGASITLVLKLFNLMIEALGPALLKRGVLIERSGWEEFLIRSRPDFWEHCQAVKLNGQEVHPRGAAPLPWPASVRWINLKVYEGSAG